MELSRSRILAVDDNADILYALRLYLEGEGADVVTATDPAAIPAVLRDKQVDAVLLDMNFSRDASSGQEGLDWLTRIGRLRPGLPVVLMTAYGEVGLAVEAMKRGGVDFLEKPWSNAQLKASMTRAVGLGAATPAPPLEVSEGVAAGGAEILGSSPVMDRVAETIAKVAPTDANVLILGENGTGKELVARAIHRLSRRADEAFVSVDVGAISASLFESELFGHARGAFTGAVSDRPGRFEVADGGTLFLDEIGNVPLSLQPKLLTTLQAREVTRLGEVAGRAVNIRVIAATNEALRAKVADGSFREDLLYRLNTIEISVPPLRERAGDIRLLAETFVARYAAKYDRAPLGISPAAYAALEQHSWPGNVRELLHACERAVVLAAEDVLRAEDFDLSSPASKRPSDEPSPTLDLSTLERDTIAAALARHGWNISRAASELGLTRKSLYRRIEKHGL